jgi:hypothetical protein
MSDPSLPPEILDHVVDLLHDEPKALRNCCIVAKPWVARTRKHLFADIDFSSPEDLESWKETFLDPSNSPAYYTRTLVVRYPQVITAADAEEGGWIRTFSRVVRLDLDSKTSGIDDSEVSLAPFYGLSPTLKRLHVLSTLLPSLQISNLVRSCPLLEDLTVIVFGVDNSDGFGFDALTLAQPSASPMLTGTLQLFLFGGMEHTVRRLLGLPNGLHFRNLVLSWSQESDIRWINALVAECSDTVEELNVLCSLFGAIVWLPR